MIAMHNVVFALPPKLSKVTTTTTHHSSRDILFTSSWVLIQQAQWHVELCLLFSPCFFFITHTDDQCLAKRKEKQNKPKNTKVYWAKKNKFTLLGFLQEFDHLKKLTFTSLELNMQCLLSSMCIFLLLQLHK